MRSLKYKAKKRRIRSRQGHVKEKNILYIYVGKAVIW